MTKKNTAAQVETNEVNPVAVAQDMLKANKTTSDIIRALAAIHTKSDGEADRGAITKTLKEAGVKTKNGTDVKYQHVRNTLLLPVKKIPSAE